jgi:hypothetical protein
MRGRANCRSQKIQKLKNQLQLETVIQSLWGCSQSPQRWRLQKPPPVLVQMLPIPTGPRAMDLLRVAQLEMAMNRHSELRKSRDFRQALVLSTGVPGKIRPRKMLQMSLIQELVCLSLGFRRQQQPDLLPALVARGCWMAVPVLDQRLRGWRPEPRRELLKRAS